MEGGYRKQGALDTRWGGGQIRALGVAGGRVGRGINSVWLRGIQRGTWGMGGRVRKEGPLTPQELNKLTFQSHDTVPLN